MNFNDGDRKLSLFERTVMPVCRKRPDNKRRFRIFTPTDSFKKVILQRLTKVSEYSYYFNKNARSILKA